jgi:hypothetical protein
MRSGGQLKQFFPQSKQASLERDQIPLPARLFFFALAFSNKCCKMQQPSFLYAITRVGNTFEDFSRFIRRPNGSTSPAAAG